MPTIKLKVSGMHCNSCKMLIEDVCKDIPGVQNCFVDFASGLTAVTHDGSTDLAHLKKEIETLGEYKVEEVL